MKLKTIFAAVCVCALALAANTKNVLEKVEEELADWVGNGSISITKYAVDEFDQKKEIAELREMTYGRCKFNIVVGRRANFKKLYEVNESDSRKPIDRLYALYKEGKIKTILARHWNGKGDPVSCSVYDFYVYTTDGNLLNLNFELTD